MTPVGYREIERKYTLNADELEGLQPELDRSPSARINQYYLNEASEPYELRLRRTTDELSSRIVATLKKGSPPDRLEMETPLKFETYDFWQPQSTAEVTKIRTTLHKQGGHWAVDSFTQHDLCLLEAEGEAVELPSFGTDVTDNEQYTNFVLASGSVKPESVDTPYPLESLQRHIEHLASRTPRPLIIGVCGATASGKTTLARQLAELWGDAAEIISQDDYYHGVTKMKQRFGADYQVNFDAPDSLDLQLLAKHLGDLQDETAVYRPTYSMATSDPIPEYRYIDPQQKRVIFVEGIHILHAPITGWLDYSIFLDTPLATRVGRRLERDLKEGRSFKPEDNLRYLLEVAEPTFAKYKEQQARVADIVL